MQLLQEAHAIHPTKDEHPFPTNHSSSSSAGGIIPGLNLDIKPNVSGGELSGGGTKMEMLKVNIDDISQFFNYHEVFGRLSNSEMPPPPTAPAQATQVTDAELANMADANAAGGENRCEICGKVFQFRYQLIVHRRYHNERKPFTCQVCGQAFQNSAELSAHGKKHIGGSMFICKVCFNVFANDASLERHMKRHSADKPFGCTICQRTFVRREHLENHARTHTGILAYNCWNRREFFAHH